MNYHVFIVDKTTFKYHLEYMFAGTGAKDKTVPFILNPDVKINATTERNLVGMIADISRIRVGDKIIFYLQSYNGKSGRFYGVFKVATTAFFDENDENNFLIHKLCKPLTFRIRIEPDTVFAYGVSEHDYLDSLNKVKRPYQMCWSLIYRKLKGNRGCTMITKYEFNSLVKKLYYINNLNNSYLLKKSKQFSFDDNSFKIIYNNSSHTYTGRTDSVDISHRMVFKCKNGNAFEAHLQAYIMQNFDKKPLNSLLIKFPNLTCWIGNEVSCGVGMQRIDIMTIQRNDQNVYIRVVELKCVKPFIEILNNQIPWYIRWVIDYMVQNYTSFKNNVVIHIIPCVLAKSTADQTFIKSCKTFSNSYPPLHKNVIIEPLEYIGFDIENNGIAFERIV